MKNRLITCVLACLMIFLVGCNGNTAKEAAQEITKTETSFPAGNTETHSQEETEKSAVREKATITADESQSTAESQTVATVQTKPAEEKSADNPVTDETSLKYEKIIDGMKCYTVEQIRSALKAAGFSSVTSDHFDGKPWICVIAVK